MADAGTGVAVAGVAAGVGWMYTYSGVSAPDGDWGTPGPTSGAGEISDSRGWCHVTSRECTTLPISASIILKQSLPPVVVSKIQEKTWARLAVHFALPRDAMVRRLAERQDRHRRAAPEEKFVRGKHAAVRRGRRAVESLRAPQNRLHS